MTGPIPCQTYKTSQSEIYCPGPHDRPQWGSVMGMEIWPYNEYFTVAEFAALPVAQQRQIALIVRALVYYLQHHSEAAAGLD